MPNFEFFISRHSKKLKKGEKGFEKYPGLSEEGIELAKERGLKEVLDFIEKTEPKSVIFLGGASEIARTKSTLKIYSETLKEILQKEPEKYLVITQKEIADPKKSYTKIVEEVLKEIQANPNKKVVIDFPLFLKQFSLIKHGWLNKKGEYSDYFKKLTEIYSKDAEKMFELWLKTEGKIENIKGPSPQEIAKDYLEGIKRLKKFLQKFIKDRPIAIGIVGHSWELDTLITYLSTGKVDLENFKKVCGDETIKETELGSVSIEGNKLKLSYREKVFEKSLNYSL